MKVLIATPTYGEGPCPETCASVAALNGDGWEWRQYRANRYPAPDERNVLAQYEAIRADFLTGDWDALLTVEHDMVLPAHALQALWETGAQVAYGVYLFRHGALVLNAWEYIGERNLGESLSLVRHRRNIPLEGVVRVSGMGFGCTLMRRVVVERFPFNDGGDVGQSPDIPFSRDCLAAGVEMVAHFGVQCGHMDEGRLLMPFEAEERRVTALATMNIGVNWASVPIVAGQTYTLPASVAAELARAGYVRIGDAAGDRDTHVQAPPPAGAKPGKPAKAKRS